jgi:thiazole/oxazole-forming peptide maturase SagD family component
MRDFSSFRSLFTQLASKKFLNEKTSAFFFYENTILSFKTIVEQYTGKKMFATVVNRSENYPPIHRTFFSLEWEETGYKIDAGATDYEKNRAELKGKGEFLERLSSFVPVGLLKKYGSDRKKIADNIQKKFLAKKFLTFGYVLVPYYEIFYGLKSERKTKSQITTNGCAGHFDKKQATVNALMELIQRDSFLMYWLNSISPKHINVKEYSKKSSRIKKLVDDFEKYNLKYYFLDTTSDIKVPTCCCILVDTRNGRHVVSLGASSGFDAEECLLSAACEAISISSSKKKGMFTFKNDYVPFSDKNIGRIERISIYDSVEEFKKMNFFIDSKESISVEDFISVSGTLLDVLDTTQKKYLYLKNLFKLRCNENKNYEILIYSIDNDLLDYFGYYVVRVMCKGLYSLYLNESFADPQHPRLKEFVKNKNLEKFAKLNIWPHPFP